MKQIQLQVTKLTNSSVPSDFELSYKKEFLRLVEIMPEGVTASQMGTQIKIAAKLQNASEKGKLFLEDAEWEMLKTKVSAAKWNFIAPEIVAMVEAVEKAEEVDTPHLRSVETEHKARRKEA